MIDFTPIPSTDTIPVALRAALKTLTPEQLLESLEWLDETPKADLCLMEFLEAAIPSREVSGD